MVISKEDILKKGNERINRLLSIGFNIDKEKAIEQGCLVYYLWFKQVIRSANRDNKRYAKKHNKKTYIKYKTSVSLDGLVEQVSKNGYIFLDVENIKSKGETIPAPKVICDNIDEDMEMGLYDDDDED